MKTYYQLEHKSKPLVIGDIGNVWTVSETFSTLQECSDAYHLARALVPAYEWRVSLVSIK